MEFCQVSYTSRAQVSLLSAALSLFSLQPVFLLGISLTHVQDLALGLHELELHEVHTGPPLKPIKVLLDSISSHQCVDPTKQIDVLSRPAKGADLSL